MAEQNDSIFTGIFNAFGRNKRKQDANKTSNDNGLLTNAPIASNPFSTKQQKQQDFLDLQSNKIAQDLFSRSVYYEADRFTAYQDYRAMDQSPEVSAALDILSDECVTKNERGEILGIYSENSRVKNTLKDLFYNVLNVNYNLGFWTRELLQVNISRSIHHWCFFNLCLSTFHILRNICWVNVSNFNIINSSFWSSNCSIYKHSIFC